MIILFGVAGASELEADFITVFLPFLSHLNMVYHVSTAQRLPVPSLQQAHVSKRYLPLRIPGSICILSGFGGKKKGFNSSAVHRLGPGI